MRFLPSNRQRPHAFLHRVSAYCTLRGYTAQSDNFPATGVAGVEKTKGRDMKYLDYFERIQHGTVSYPIAYYHVTHDHPRYEMIHHWHIEHELIVVESGFLNVNLDGTDYRLGAGDACFISDGVVHSAKPEHAVYDSIVFDMRALLTRNQAGNKAISDIISHHRVVTPILPSGDEKILSLAASIREASENGANGLELVVQRRYPAAYRCHNNASSLRRRTDSGQAQYRSLRAIQASYRIYRGKLCLENNAR